MFPGLHGVSTKVISKTKADRSTPFAKPQDTARNQPYSCPTEQNLPAPNA